MRYQCDQKPLPWWSLAHPTLSWSVRLIPLAAGSPHRFLPFLTVPKSYNMHLLNRCVITSVQVTATCWKVGWLSETEGLSGPCVYGRDFLIWVTLKVGRNLRGDTQYLNGDFPLLMTMMCEWVYRSFNAHFIGHSLILLEERVKTFSVESEH